MGELVLVEVLNSQQEDKGFRVMLRYRYRIPAGVVLEGSIAGSEGAHTESPNLSVRL